MSKILLVLFVLLTITTKLYGAKYPKPCAANERCVLLVETTTDNDGDFVTWEGGWYFILNGHEVNFKLIKADYEGKIALSYAIVPEYLLDPITNKFYFTVGHVDSSPYDGTDFYYWYPPESTYLSESNEVVEICKNEWQLGTPIVGCRKVEERSLNSLDPELYQEFQQLKKKRKELQKEVGDLTLERDAMSEAIRKKFEEAQAKLKEMQDIINRLEGIDIEELDASHLAPLGKKADEVEEVLTSVRKEIDGLKGDIDTEIKKNEEEIDKFKEELKEDFKNSSEDLEELVVDLEFEIPPIEIPKLEGIDDYMPEEFDRQATEIIDRLKDTYQRNDRTEFKKILYAWTLNQEYLRTNVLKPGMSVTIKQAFLNAEKKVINFKDKYLDADGFFKDVKVSSYYRQILKTHIKQMNGPLANDLINEVNTWNKDLNANQRSVLESVEKIGKTYSRLQRANPTGQNKKNVSVLESVEKIGNTDSRLNDANSTKQNKKNAKKMAIVSLNLGMESTLAASKKIQHKEIFNKNIQESNIYIKIAIKLADFFAGLSPIGPGKDLLEASTGIRLTDNSELDFTDRSILAISGGIGIAAGILTGGTGAGATSSIAKTGLKTVGAIFKVAKKMLSTKVIKVVSRTLSKSFNAAKGFISSAAKLGFTKGSQLSGFIKKPIGKAWAKIKATGQAVTEKGYKLFKKDVPVNNPFPEHGVYARIVDKRFADKIRKGELPLSRPNSGNEAFVTALDDIKDVANPKDYAKKLSLYTDKAGTQLVDTAEHTVLKFKFKPDIQQSIRSPVELLEKRNFGFIPGGRTKGNAREWLIDNDAFQRGLIEFID
jgi:hypothetical protein